VTAPATDPESPSPGAAGAGADGHAATAAPAAGPPLIDRRLPPIAPVAVASLVVVIIGGIYVGAQLPSTPQLAVSFGLIGLAAALTAAALAMLSRVRPFAWHRFIQVGGWTLLAYVVIAGMLELIFILDGIGGGLLANLSLTLALFAVDVPLIVAFTVARYQEPNPGR
jgi:hypothetical protein